MAQAIPIGATTTWARFGDRPRREPRRLLGYATIASTAFLAAMLSLFWLASSLVPDIQNWIMSSESVETGAGAAILDLLLLGLWKGHRLSSPLRRVVAAQSDETALLAQAGYRIIAEGNRGRVSMDTLVWRCAVHQRDGPGRGTDGLDTKA